MFPHVPQLKSHQKYVMRTPLEPAGYPRIDAPHTMSFFQRMRFPKGRAK